jgi:hypothetical protein
LAHFRLYASPYQVKHLDQQRYIALRRSCPG